MLNVKDKLESDVNIRYWFPYWYRTGTLVTHWSPLLQLYWLSEWIVSGTPCPLVNKLIEQLALAPKGSIQPDINTLYVTEVSAMLNLKVENQMIVKAAELIKCIPLKNQWIRRKIIFLYYVVLVFMCFLSI